MVSNIFKEVRDHTQPGMEWRHCHIVLKMSGMLPKGTMLVP